MKSLMWLLSCVLEEMSTRCDTDTHRDYLTVSRRIEDEGMSFLTISLPNFARDFERGLELSQVDSSAFLGFRKVGALPALLRGLTSQVFDPWSGMLLETPNVEAIICVRQFCLMFKKVSLPCSVKRVEAAYEGYLKCEYELAGLPATVPQLVYDQFGRVSDIMWGSVLADVDLSVYAGDLVPRHGPGATAERVTGNSKYRFDKWHTRLDSSFPFDQYRTSNPAQVLDDDELDLVKLVEPGAETPVRVVTVPKTLKTPRIIAIEPVCMQYTQQALAIPIINQVERHELTAGHINFRDQSINQRLALESSVSGEFATIDLSEASDRVHKDLVYRMLRSVPHLKGAVFACRSASADLPWGNVSLNKFASMGSALCFPVEALLFYTVCVLARCIVHNIPLTRQGVMYASRRVYVYGDDIIVPADEVSAVSFALNSFGLKVNIHKSFGIGKFRESCGMDAYDGVNVTPTYLRRLPPSNRREIPELVSFVAFANQLYTKGWWTAARRVREHIELIFGPVPHVRDTSPCLGWTSVDQRYTVHGWDGDHHRPLIKGMVVTPKCEDDPLEGYGALMKFFLKVGKDPASEGHLERSVRSGRVRIKDQWAPPY